MKIPTPVLLPGLPSPNTYYDFTDSGRILRIHALGNGGGLNPGLIVTSKLGRN